MKKSWFIIGVLFSILFLSSFVSAQSAGAQLGREIGGFFQGIYESIPFFSVVNLSKVFLGILLWIVIFSIAKQIGWFKSESGRINWLAGAFALIVTILSFLYLPDVFIETIVLQYGVMGATILTVIPFIILLYFSLAVTQSILIARVTWVFWIFYYLGIFSYKLFTLPEGAGAGEYIPYVIALGAGLVVIFLLRWMRALVFHGRLEDLDEKGTEVAKKSKLLHKLQREELDGYKS